MAEQDVFFSGDEELEALLLTLEGENVEEDHNFVKDIEDLVGGIESDFDAKGYICSHCEKLCKSARGLTRHMNAKHRQTVEKAVAVESKFDRTVDEDCFGILVGNSVTKLAVDECLPDGISLEFKTFNLLPSEISCCFSYVKEVVDRFIVAGNGERFFPAFILCS